MSLLTMSISAALFVCYFTTDCAHSELLISSALFWIAFTMTNIKIVNIFERAKDEKDEEEKTE